MPQADSTELLDDGRVDFRALVEANTRRVDAAAKLAAAEEEQYFGPPPTGHDVAAYEELVARAKAEQEQAIAAARDRHKVAEARFLLTKDAFESANGPIVDYYFARTVREAGAALTRGHYVRRYGPVVPVYQRGPSECHAHNLVLFDLPDEPALVSLRVGFAKLLHRIDAKQTSVQYMLRGLSQRVLMIRLFALRRDMISDLDDAREGLGCGGSEGNPTPSRKKAVAARLAQSLAGYEQEFRSIARTYGQAAAREARIIYLSGMLVGLVLLAVLALVLGLLLSFTDLPIDLDTFLTCLAAGAVGAFVSVLQRMSAGKFSVNHEVGREYVQRLAYFRPFLGSIFGLAVFFALEGGLANITPPLDPPQRYAFFAFIAFLAGFSERFAQEILGSPSGSDTEGPDLAASDELGSAGERFVELASSNGDQEVMVETTRATSKPAQPTKP
jgi:hypothetical protein